MNKKERKKLKSILHNLHEACAVVYFSYGHLFVMEFDEAKKTTKESKEKLEEIKKLIKELIDE